MVLERHCFLTPTGRPIGSAAMGVLYLFWSNGFFQLAAES